MNGVESKLSSGKRRDYFGITLSVDPAGRRIWQPALCQRIAEASFESGKSLESFAAEWDVNPSSLSKWRMALRRKHGASTSSSTTISAKSQGAAVNFAAVAVADNTEDAAPPKNQAIEIDFRGLKVRMPVDASPEAVRNVIEAVRGPS